MSRMGSYIQMLGESSGNIVTIRSDYGYEQQIGALVSHGPYGEKYLFVGQHQFNMRTGKSKEKIDGAWWHIVVPDDFEEPIGAVSKIMRLFSRE